MVTAVDDTRLLEAFLAIGTVLRTCAHGHVVGPASKPMGQLIVRRYDNLVLECCYGWAPAGGHVCDEGVSWTVSVDPPWTWAVLTR